MSRVVASSMHKATRPRVNVKPLTLEEEVFSLRTLAPTSLAQLPDLFAKSVVDSASKVLGEETSEALIRCIGDARLRDPDLVYSCLDSFLLGGSEGFKQAIRLTFATRVHRLYKLTLDLAK